VDSLTGIGNEAKQVKSSEIQNLQNDSENRGAKRFATALETQLNKCLGVVGEAKRISVAIGEFSAKHPGPATMLIDLVDDVPLWAAMGGEFVWQHAVQTMPYLNTVLHHLVSST